MIQVNIARARVGEECNVFLASAILFYIIRNKTVHIIIIIRLFHLVNITKIMEFSSLAAILE